MENTEPVQSKSIEGFFKHVFNLNDSSKHLYMNLFQYVVLAIIPILVLNKMVISRLISETDDEKNSLEISFEVVAQVILIFGGYILIDRIVNYIPTYSGVSYEAINYFSIVIPFLIITLSIQSKLGEKVGILWERLMEYIGMADKPKVVKKEEGAVRVKQPIMQGPPPPQITSLKNEQQSTNVNYNNTIQERNYDTQSTSINNLPLPNNQAQQAPNFNEMYNSNEVLAANSMGGWGAPF
jgi:hypothetical protein